MSASPTATGLFPLPSGTVPAPRDVRAFALDYGAAIDAAGRVARTPAGIADESIAAFRLEIELSDAVQRSTTATPPDL